jgi:hypothetical protein
LRVVEIGWKFDPSAQVRSGSTLLQYSKWPISGDEREVGRLDVAAHHLVASQLMPFSNDTQPGG